MKPIDYNKVNLRNVLSMIENPILTDLLFEIANFLTEENRLDGVFTTKELSSKTSVRISSDLKTDLSNLISEGYISKEGRELKVVEHPW